MTLLIIWIKSLKISRNKLTKGYAEHPGFKNDLRGFLEEEDRLDRLSRLTLETGKSQVYQCHDILSHGFKREKLQYEKNQKGRERY